MPLPQTIREDMTTAWRARETRRRDILRLLISALDYARIAAGHELTDEEAIETLQREAKQRRDSIVQYREGNRDDLVAVEQEELELIGGYLPEPLSDEDVRAAAREVIAEVGAAGPADVGKVMRPLMQRVSGRADGRRASELVRELLASG